jgi:hypothetical protein
MSSGSEHEELRRRAERARRRARVFGEVLPDDTRDDRPTPDTGTGPSAAPTEADDEWLRANVPPHHGS